MHYSVRLDEQIEYIAYSSTGEKISANCQCSLRSGSLKYTTSEYTFSVHSQYDL